MIISNVNDGAKVEYSLAGTVLNVGTVTIDLQERQTDSQVVINVCLDNQLQTMREGLGAWYVANVIVPPKQYELVSTGEQDADGNDTMKEQEIPLDMSKVELRLWGLPVGYGQSNESEGVTE